MSRTLAGALLASVCVAMGAGCSSTKANAGSSPRSTAEAQSLSETRSLNERRSPSAASTSVTERIVAKGITRTYLLHEPSKRPIGKVALMIALHGGFSSAAEMENLSHFGSLADKKGFIIAYPEALKGIWDIGCCTAALASRNDVNFIATLIDHLVSTANVDPERVYVTGFSVGAAMTYRLACELAGKIAGAGSVGGYEYLSRRCAPAKPVSIMEVHGTRDYFGGSCGGNTETNRGCKNGFGRRGYEPSVRETDTQWRRLDGCNNKGSTARFTATLAVTSQSWESCDKGSAVRLDVVTEGTHCWPDQSAAGCATYSASEALWSFFSAHPRREGKRRESTRRGRPA